MLLAIDEDNVIATEAEEGERLDEGEHAHKSTATTTTVPPKMPRPTAGLFIAIHDMRETEFQYWISLDTLLDTAHSQQCARVWLSGSKAFNQELGLRAPACTL